MTDETTSKEQGNQASPPQDADGDNGPMTEQPENADGDQDDGEDTGSIIFRMEDMCSLPGGRLVIADHANGILVFSHSGEVEEHLHNDVDTLAFGCKYDSKTASLVTLVLDTPGWRLNFYNPSSFSIRKQINLPDMKDVPRMKLRWLTITPNGDIYITVGSTIWNYDQESDKWNIVHKDNRKGMWYSQLTKVGGPEEEKFLVCVKGSQLHEVVLSPTGLKTVNANVLGDDVVGELGAYTVDKEGNILVGDWSNGNLILLDPHYQPLRQVANVGPNEAYMIVACAGRSFVGCKSSLLVKAFDY